MSHNTRLLLLDSVALLIVLGLCFGPDFGGGWLGRVLVFAAIGATLYGWLLLHRRLGDTRSLNEQLSGVWLVFVAAITVLFFWGLQQLGWQTDLNDPGTRALKSTAFTFFIGYLILSAVIVQQQESLLRGGGEPAEDERDREIRARAASAGSTALQIGVIAVIIQIAAGSVFIARHIPLFDTPLNIAHALVGAFIIAELVKSATEVWLYRRDAVGAEDAAADAADAPKVKA